MTANYNFVEYRLINRVFFLIKSIPTHIQIPEYNPVPDQIWSDMPQTEHFISALLTRPSSRMQGWIEAADGLATGIFLKLIDYSPGRVATDQLEFSKQDTVILGHLGKIALDLLTEAERGFFLVSQSQSMGKDSEYQARKAATAHFPIGAQTLKDVLKNRLEQKKGLVNPADTQGFLDPQLRVQTEQLFAYALIATTAAQLHAQRLVNHQSLIDKQPIDANTEKIIALSEKASTAVSFWSADRVDGQHAYHTIRKLKIRTRNFIPDQRSEQQHLPPLLKLWHFYTALSVDAKELIVGQHQDQQITTSDSVDQATTPEITTLLEELDLFLSSDAPESPVDDFPG